MGRGPRPSGSECRDGGRGTHEADGPFTAVPAFVPVGGRRGPLRIIGRPKATAEPPSLRSSTFDSVFTARSGAQPLVPSAWEFVRRRRGDDPAVALHRLPTLRWRCGWQGHRSARSLGSRTFTPRRLETMAGADSYLVASSPCPVRSVRSLRTVRSAPFRSSLQAPSAKRQAPSAKC